MIEVFEGGGNKPVVADNITLVRVWTKGNHRCWKITVQPDGQLQVEVLSVTDTGVAHDVPMRLNLVRSNLLHLDTP